MVYANTIQFMVFICSSPANNIHLSDSIWIQQIDIQFQGGVVHIPGYYNQTNWLLNIMKNLGHENLVNLLQWTFQLSKIYIEKIVKEPSTISYLISFDGIFSKNSLIVIFNIVLKWLPWPYNYSDEISGFNRTVQSVKKTFDY